MAKLVQKKYKKGLKYLVVPDKIKVLEKKERDRIAALVPKVFTGPFYLIHTVLGKNMVVMLNLLMLIIVS